MLMPMWNREGKDMIRWNEEFDTPLGSLQRDINRMFGEVWNRWERPFGGYGAFMPVGSLRTDVAETVEDVEVTVELPGLDKKDVEITVTGDVLMIRGEKKADREENRKDFYLSERAYGAFYRSIPLPAGIDWDRAEARFDRGVLTVHLPKTVEAMDQVKRIEIRGN